MIEVSASSASAMVAANAERAIARISEELTALQAQSEGWRAEMRELLAERAAAEQLKADLGATTASTKADLERCRLAEELAAGTALEGQAHEATEQASRLWDAARQDEHQALQSWGKRSAQIEDRLSFLQRSLDEAAEMAQSQQGKLAALRTAYDSAHADHGKDEQAQLEREFAAIAEKRQAVLQQLAAVEQEEAALRETIPARLKDWPSLARESLTAYLGYEPGPWVKMLQAWQTLATLAGDHPREVDEQTFRAFIGSGLPLWHLGEYGGRAKIEQMPERRRDEPLKWYLRMLADLRATLDRLEQRERQAQVTQRMQAQGL